MQFQSWMADYLHSLWHAKDPSLPPVVLPAAKPLLEGNPKLGLSVFISMDGETADGTTAGIPTQAPRSCDQRAESWDGGPVCV